MKRRKKYILPILGAILVAVVGSYVAGGIATEPRMTCVTRLGYACASTKEELDKSRGADFAALMQLQKEGVLSQLEQGRKAAVMETDGEACKILLSGGLVVWTACNALDCQE